MPSYAGFYVSPQGWADWLRPRRSRPGAPAIAELMLQKEICKKKLGNHFAVTMVPKPPTASTLTLSPLPRHNLWRIQEPGELEEVGLMVYRMHSYKRVYMSQRAASKIDTNGQQIIERLFGLKASEWRTIWFDGESTEPPYEAEFLDPTPSENDNDSEGKIEEENKMMKEARDKNKRVKFEDEGVYTGDDGDTNSKNQL